MLVSMLGSLPTEVKVANFSFSALITMFTTLVFFVVLLKVKISFKCLPFILPYFLFVTFDTLGFLWGSLSISVIQNWVVWVGGFLVFVCFASIREVGRYVGAFNIIIKISFLPYSIFMSVLMLMGKDDPASVQLTLIFFSFFCSKFILTRSINSLIALLFLVLVPIFTASRIVLIAELVAGGYVFLMLEKYRLAPKESPFKWILPFASFFLILGVMFFAFSSSKNMEEANFNGDNALQVGSVNISTAGRLYWWERSFKSAMIRPFFGHGTDGSPEMLASRQWKHPHNDYLRIFHHLGLVGLFLWAIFILKILQVSYRGLRYTQNLSFQHVYLTGHLSIVFMSIVMFTDNTITYSYILFPCLAVLGITVSCFLNDSTLKA